MFLYCKWTKLCTKKSRAKDKNIQWNISKAEKQKIRWKKVEEKKILNRERIDEREKFSSSWILFTLFRMSVPNGNTSIACNTRRIFESTSIFTCFFFSFQWMEWIDETKRNENRWKSNAQTYVNNLFFASKLNTSKERTKKLLLHSNHEWMKWRPKKERKI